MCGYRIAFRYGPLGDEDEVEGVDAVVDAVWAVAAHPRWRDTEGRVERVTFAVDGSELQPIIVAFLAHSRSSWRLSISPIADETAA
jgi:hypothetical protein